MLFNLSSRINFPSKHAGTDINCSKEYGPCFSGSNDSELDALCEPFNGDGNCASFTNMPGYDIPKVDGVNMLTNKKNGNFTISELEVWEVIGYVLEDKLVFYDTFELKMERRRKLKELGFKEESDKEEDEEEGEDDDHENSIEK
jgi:hypothetical protein